MKKLIYVGLALGMSLMSLASKAQDGFTIQGKLLLAEDGQRVYLDYRNNGVQQRDSGVIKNSEFRIIGKVTEPSKASLTLAPLIEDKGPLTIFKIMALDKQEFFLENTDILVKGQLIKTALISGGSSQADFTALVREVSKVETKMKPITDKVMAKLEKDMNAPVDSLLTLLKPFNLEIKEIQNKFIYDHPDSYVSLGLVDNKAVVIQDVDSLEPYYNALSERLKLTSVGKSLKERIETAKKISTGKMAIDVEQKDPNGQMISLKSLRGKYVLLDFWASWCGPCRQENPKIKLVYEKYKSKNFEILAVSLDQDKAAWQKAIADDGLPWLHVSDLKGWKNEAALAYGVHAVPQNFLIDPDGRIVSSNLRGEALEDKLKELFNNK